jgi:hypothetical protein
MAKSTWLFSNLNEKLSEQDKIFGELIDKTAEKIREKIDSVSMPIAVRVFLSCANNFLVSLLITFIIFSDDKPKESNLFIKYKKLLTPESIFEFFKFLIGHWATVVLKNEEDFFKIYKVSKEEFKEILFDVLSYTDEDKNIFNGLLDLYNDKDAVQYGKNLYKFLTERAFGSEDKDILAAKVFIDCIARGYSDIISDFNEKIVFMNNLRNRLEYKKKNTA